jgi:hypothetical protein
MKTNPLLLLSALLFLFCSCSTDTLLSETEWLLGTWENKTPDGTIYESWSRENDSLFMGRSYAITGKDTLHLESIQLREQDGSLYYVPTVVGQNDEMPVSFKAIILTKDELHFENIVHDFPQLITYKRISADSIVAEISGMIEGQNQAQRFPMRRLN